MKNLHMKLEKKGWPAKEVHKILRILKEAEHKKGKLILWLDVFVIWMFLIISIVGTFLVSVILVPLLLVMKGLYLYGMLFVIGLFFGLLLDSTLVHLRKVWTKHLIMPNILLPTLAVINVYLITKFSNDIIESLKLPTLTHSPTLVSTVYVLAFILPHFLRLIILDKENYICQSHQVYKSERTNYRTRA